MGSLWYRISLYGHRIGLDDWASNDCVLTSSCLPPRANPGYPASNQTNASAALSFLNSSDSVSEPSSTVDAHTTPASIRYVRAIYWSIVTMNTVGYGDIQAKSIPETLYSIVAMVGGALIYGTIIAQMAK